MSDEQFLGIEVQALLPGSLAAKCGVQEGDLILSVNGKQIKSLQDYVDARYLDREKLELLVKRGDEVIEASLVFENPDPDVSVETPTSVQDAIDELTARAQIEAMVLGATKKKPGLPN